MIRFYDLANDVVRVCNLDGSESHKEEIEKDEVYCVSTFVYPPFEHASYTVVTWMVEQDGYSPISRVGRFVPAWKTGHMAEMLNKWNALVIKYGNPLTMAYDNTDANKVILTNTSFENVVLANVATFGPYESLSLSIDTLVQKTSFAWPKVIETEEPALFLRAYLFRKNEKGYYTRDEVVNVPSGIFWNLDGFVYALNLRISMRGERNGFIYSFSSKNGVLQMNAVHRQPKNSYMDIVPLSNVFGLNETSKLILRTKGKCTFPNEICV